MFRNVVSVLLVAGSMFAGAGAHAAEQPKPLYLRTIERYPAPKLEEVGGRELKFLLDGAKLPEKPEAAFALVWSRVKASGAKHGFTVTEKAEAAMKVEQSYKEYFDTADQALWKKGFLIRITQKYKKGVAEPEVSVTVKAINQDANVTLATPLKVVGVEKVKTEAEENVGMGVNGQLAGYVEKGSSFTVFLDKLGQLTLGDFAKYMPELGNLGIPGNTQLVGKRAYSVRARPGTVTLPGTEPCGVSMEGWSAKPGERPTLFDFSIGYSDIDFYDSAQTHEAGEKFLLNAIQGELADLAMAEGEKWGGSKVRKLMNRAVIR
jgi:hypothetical protein